MIVPRLLVAVCFVVLASAVSGAEIGYWACAKGQWIAVGEPSHNRPLRDCIEKPPVPKTDVRCDALGGTWGSIGIFPTPVCRMPARDAGRICGDADECDSTCLAKVSGSQVEILRRGGTVPTLGRCAPAYPVVGCIAVVEKNEVRRLLCLD